MACRKLQILWDRSLRQIPGTIRIPKAVEASSLLMTDGFRGITYDIDAAVPGYGDDSVEGAEISANNGHVGALW
jgi:hypothetical protein